MPANVYCDPVCYDRAKERVFARSCQFVGEAAQMKSPGHVRPFPLLESCLDEPLLLTIDETLQTHCLSNVCTHRGALVIEGVYPLGLERTKVSFLSYVWDKDRQSSGVGADLHRVEMEDDEVVESVQRGVRSRLYDRGRYSPRREAGTDHFHKLLARFLNG